MTVRGPIRLPKEQLQPYLFQLSPDPTVLDWPAVFGNDRPVEIEVGFGKGLFLLTSSQGRPDVNFLGVEIERHLQLFTANRLAKRGLANVRLVCTDARALLQQWVPAASVQAVHVYFPDPWWKRRHLKRRLFSAEFALACHRVLAAGGRLEVMSDVEAYFTIMTAILADPGRWRKLDETPCEGTYRTSFQRKYLLAGKPIFGASYVKAEMS